MKFGRTQSPKFSGIAQKFSDNPAEVERFYKSDTPKTPANQNSQSNSKACSSKKTTPRSKHFNCAPSSAASA